MLMKITRTSIWSDEDQGPCPEAVRGLEPNTVRVDRRTTDDPAKVPSAKGQSEWWCSEGRNHRIENGMICRDFDMTESQRACWVIDFSVYEDFISFLRKYGTLVFKAGQYGYLDELEIYDDYRE